MEPLALGLAVRRGWHGGRLELELAQRASDLRVLVALPVAVAFPVAVAVAVRIRVPRAVPLAFAQPALGRRRAAGAN